MLRGSKVTYHFNKPFLSDKTALKTPNFWNRITRFLRNQTPKGVKWRGFWAIRHLKGLSASWRVWTVDIELAWTIIRWVDISEPMTIVVCFVDFISRHHIVSPKHGVEYLMRSEEIDFDLNPLQLPCSVGKLSYSIPQTNTFLETHLFR